MLRWHHFSAIQKVVTSTFLGKLAFSSSWVCIQRGTRDRVYEKFLTIDKKPRKFDKRLREK